MDGERYETDVSDAEWQILASRLPAPEACGGPRKHHLRDIMDAILWVVRGGCGWRLLPHDFPPWKTVYHYFRPWRPDGTWQRVHAALGERERSRLGRDPRPGAGIVDSQPVETTGGAGERDYDGGEKIDGRKRHLLVDTEGLVLRATVHPASVMDRDGIEALLEGASARFARLEHLWLDSGSNGEGRGEDWMEKTPGWARR